MRILPFEPDATSARLGWVGLEAAHFRATPAFELNDAVLTHHHLALFARPPEQLDVRFEGVTLFHQINQDAGNRVVILTGAGEAFVDRSDPEGFDFFSPRGYDKIYREGKKVLSI